MNVKELLELSVGDKVVVSDAGSRIIGYVEDVRLEDSVILVHIEDTNTFRWVSANITEKCAGGGG